MALAAPIGDEGTQVGWLRCQRLQAAYLELGGVVTFGRLITTD